MPIEGEAAAIAWVLEKCCIFIMGCPVVTGHQPLTGIFGDSISMRLSMSTNLSSLALEARLRPCTHTCLNLRPDKTVGLQAHDALAPGCDKIFTVVKMSLHKDAGTYGRNSPVLLSQFFFCAV